MTTEDGTGLVHLAPAFGADDLAVVRANGMPVVNPVRADGRFEEGLPLVGGLFFKDADEPLTADLDQRGLLFRSEPHVHSYPHCWRCGTTLLYYALPSWYIRTTLVKDQLLAENEKTNWQPPTIKNGRYGEWLRNNVDWALSRTRYWGTPLPAVGVPVVARDLRRVARRARRPRRPRPVGARPAPAVRGRRVFPCPECGLCRRSRSRGDRRLVRLRFDAVRAVGRAAAEPAAFESAYPAQFICEAIDQTRGWFYSLMAVGTLVFGRSAYENVVCLGLVTDEQGRKMSKHLGNVIEPMGLIDAHGADAVRWFFAASGSPWGQRRIGAGVLARSCGRCCLPTGTRCRSWCCTRTRSGCGAGWRAGAAWTPEDAALAPARGAAAARPLAAFRGARLRAGGDGRA